MNARGHVDDQRAQLAQQIDDLIGQGQYQLALQLAIELVERTLTECRLAALFQAINDMTAADNLVEQGLQILRDHDYQIGVAESLNNLALLYKETGRYGAFICQGDTRPLAYEIHRVYPRSL